MTEKTESEKKIQKNYQLFLAGVFIFLVGMLGRTFLNAGYTVYVLARIFTESGFEILNDASRSGLIEQYAVFKYAAYSWAFLAFSWTSLVSVAAVFVIGAAFNRAMVFLTAQFVLPVNLPEDRKKASGRLASYIAGDHGAAVFVKEGTLIERHQEADGKKAAVKPGVIVVDLSSAVVLAKNDDTHAWNLVDSQEEEFEGLTRRVTIPKDDHKNSSPFVETKGPGLVFTGKGQKIFSVLDLRPQTRGKAVEAYTRDGIKLSTKVSVGFSLSDRPEVIPVGFVEGENGRELSWLNLEKSPDGEQVTLKSSFDLDEQDKQELLDYFNNKSDASFAPEEPDPTNAITPYRFYPNRVFNAAYSKARAAGTGEFVPWFDAPLEIAVDIFRKELAAIPYDSIYDGLDLQQRNVDATERPSLGALTLKRLKDDFGRRVKLKGIVNFQFHVRKKDEPFKVGEKVELRLVSRHPIIALSQSKFNSLRSVGVVVKSAGFGDLQPVNPEIKKQMIENWKAKWEKEVQFINAEYELEAVRVRNRNRAQIQQEMTYLLAGIFQNSHTDEALALRVFQALESAASNPTGNGDISPKEIVSMLESLHKWLLIERKGVLDVPFMLDDKTTKG